MAQRIEISPRSIIFTVLLLLFLFFLYQIKSIILLLFVVIILTTALTPLVRRFEGMRIPKGLSIFLIYLIFIGSFLAIIYSVLPAMIDQNMAFFNTLPELLKKSGLVENVTPDMILPQLSSIPGSVFHLFAALFSNIITIITTLVLTFYLLNERSNLNQHIHRLFNNEQNEEKVLGIITKIENDIGTWIRGELLLMLIIGISSYIGYRLLGLEFAAALAVLAGFLEIVPNIGPVIAAVPAIIVGLSMSPAVAIGVVILSIAIQQVENNVVVPQVMKKVIGLNPIVTIICLSIGFTLGGAGGAILAIPAFLALKTILPKLYSLRNLN